jgi:hypothetical protein
MYIKTFNLIISMTIHIPKSCLHGGVVSGSCHSSEREREREREKVSVSAYTRPGGKAAFPSCIQGRRLTCRLMRIPHPVPRRSGFSM